jgi:predicted transcriptional regulator
MEITHQRITIVKVRKPVKKNLNRELLWFGNSLGLFSPRDKEKSCFRIFIELLKATKDNKPMSSDQIAYKLHLSRGTVMHHINKLMEAGIVISQRGKYILRVGNLEAVVEELQKDLNRTCEDLKQIAKEIDEGIGL